MERYKTKSGTVSQHQNLKEVDHLNKENDLSQRFFNQLWDLYEELL